MSIATLSIDLVAKIATFEKDLKQVAAASEASAARIGQSMDTVKTAVGGLAGLATVDLFGGLVTRSADYSDNIGKMAQKVGATTEEFSALSYAASLADVSNETLAGGLKKLSTEIVSGGEKLAQLGIKTTDATGKLRSNADIMGDVAERFATMEDGALKTAIAVDIFGKSGSDMIPLLNSGRDGLKDATDEAQRFGLVVSKEAAVAAEQFNDNLTRLAALGKGAAVALTSDLVKGLGEATKAFLEANTEGGKLAGIIAGIQTVLTGTDRYKNDKALVEQTEELLQAENELARARGAAIKMPGRVLVAEAEVKRLQDAIRLTQQYRKVLDDVDAQNAPKPKGPAPDYKVKDPKAPAAVREIIGDDARALAQYVKGLDAATQKTQELTEAEKARLFLSTLGTTGEVEQVRELVLGMATRIDKEKELNEVLKLRRAAATAPGDAVNAKNEWLASLLSGTATAKLEDQRGKMQELADLFSQGVFGDPASQAAAEKYGEVVHVQLGTAAEAVAKLDGDFASLGATFSSSLEDAIVKGGSLREVVQGLGDDILRIAVRKSITEPLGNAVGDLFKGFSLKSIFGFADGGIMTSTGPVPLQAYATGGIATRPQLALYGEGAMPEAYVPLPDGKTIPVSVRYGSDGTPTATVPLPGGRRIPVTLDIPEPAQASVAALAARPPARPVATRGEDFAAVESRPLPAGQRLPPALDMLLRPAGVSAFASGGVMTRLGPVPLQTYATGGIATRPQLALYGEGAMPEAYVPLPDGKTIPVSVRYGSDGTPTATVPLPGGRRIPATLDMPASPAEVAAFAGGGVMTSAGPVPLRAYATGGIASSPQLALYGEGATPEAFVPLPNGRSIPVEMRGGGSGQTVVINITNNIGNVASQTDVVQGMRTVRAQIMGELARGQRMGGNFS